MTIAEFLAKYASSGSGNFRTGQTRGIGSDDMREFATDISTLSDLNVYNLNRLVSKSGHGFAVKNVITLNSSGVHVKVSDPDADKFVGIVTEVPDANSFRIHTAGYVTGLSGLTAGAIHYAQTDGTLGTTVTDMPVLFADSTTSGYILASGATGSAGLRLGTAAGTDTYTLTLSPALTAYTDGLALLVKFTNANTGAATLNVNSLGAKDIVISENIPLVAGQLSGDKYYMLVYDGTRFQVSDIPFVSNTTNAKAAYIDASGRLRWAEGSLFSPINRAWQFTGADNGNTVMFAWLNSDEANLFRIWNNFQAEFGHNGTHVIKVATDITNGNALFLVPTDQDQAYQFQDHLFNKLFRLKTTDGDPAVVIESGLEKDFQIGFVNKTRQASATTTTTQDAQNVIAAIDVPDGYDIVVRVKMAIASASSGARLQTCHPFMAIGARISGTLSGSAESATALRTGSGSPSSGGFNINFNDSTKQVEIRFQNESGTGFAYSVRVEFDYILTEIPS